MPPELLTDKEIKEAEEALKSLEALGRALLSAPPLLKVVRRGNQALFESEQQLELLRGQHTQLARETETLQARHDEQKAQLDQALADHRAKVHAELAEASRQATLQKNALEEERQRILAELRNEQAKVEQIRRQAQVAVREEDDRITAKRLEVAKELARLDEDIAAKRRETEVAREEYRKVNEAIDALARRGR